MMSHRAIASPLTEDSSVSVLDAAFLVADNDNMEDPAARTSPSRFAVPLLAFTSGFLVAGVLAALERFASHAV